MHEPFPRIFNRILLFRFFSVPGRAATVHDGFGFQTEALDSVIQGPAATISTATSAAGAIS